MNACTFIECTNVSDLSGCKLPQGMNPGTKLCQADATESQTDIANPTLFEPYPFLRAFPEMESSRTHFEVLGLGNTLSSTQGHQFFLLYERGN